MLYMENTEPRSTGTENGSEWPNGTVHSDWTGPSEKVVHHMQLQITAMTFHRRQTGCILY